MRVREPDPSASQPSDAFFRWLVESVDDSAIFMLDPNGRVQTWHRGAERMLGYPADEIIGQFHTVFYPPVELRSGKPEYVLRAVADEGTFDEEHWRVRRDGSRFWASVVITALRSPQGELLGFANVLRDLTARQQAEDDRTQLLRLERDARARTEQAVEQLQAMQAVTDAALAHLELDALLQALLEHLSELLQVDTVVVLLLTDDGQWLVPRAARGIEEEVTAGIHLPLGRGFAGRVAAERRPIVLDDVEHADVLNPILRQKGINSLLGVPLIVESRIVGVLHVGSLRPRHFTEEETRFLQVAADRIALAIEHARLYEAAERARQAAEAAGQEVRLRDEFLSVAAHELRTPITGLHTAAQLILLSLGRSDGLSTERLTRMATIIDRESEKLARLVSQLLDLSRLKGGKLALECSEVDLVALARAVSERIQTHAPPTTEIRVLGADSLWIWADPLRIEQVLANLLDNAVKYSPEGSEITVECTQPTAEVAQIAVQDRGIGISAAEQERVFERFYQVETSERQTGLGLGLAISREIAERHSGRLWAESPPEGGARLVLELPVGAAHDSP